MDEKLHIAQVAPLAESVPPKMYGGTERVVSYLTEELVDRGHDVTLFASGDSATSAELVGGSERALRLSNDEINSEVKHMVMLEALYRRADEFDVIHSHIGHLPFPVARRLKVPCVTTLHGRLDLPQMNELFGEFDDVPVVSISESQRRPVPEAWWAETVYHGLPTGLYRYNPDPGDYLAFVGRVSPEKRIDAAIRSAVQAGMRIKIAAKVDPADEPYFRDEISPLLDHPEVEFVGEIDESRKESFLGNARALMFMVDWPEPFGLAMIEAMACGTPVIARNCGAIPEVVDNGESGFVCDDEAEAVEAIERLDNLPRQRVRQQFERRFTAERMAEDYVETYRHLVKHWEKASMSGWDMRASGE